MNNHDILDMIGEVSSKYVWEAQQVRCGQAASARKRNTAKRIWLIAAAITLMLLLLGCTVTYLLNLQSLKVGEIQFDDPDGTAASDFAESEAIVLISLQNTNQEALSEWLTFRESYDRDGSLLAANDNNQSQIPEPYWSVYRCYTAEMVKKLDEIAKKYDLQLLSQEVALQYYEYQVLLDALGIESLFLKDAPVKAEYGTSYFYAGGTFDVDFTVSAHNDPVCSNLPGSMRYSLKSYFDPVCGSLGGSIQDYEQWKYTRSDGKELLLAIGNDSARIYADLPDAFISIQLDFYDRFPRATKERLEEISEYFDFSIAPRPAAPEDIELLLEEAKSAHKDKLTAEENALYNHGFDTYVEQLLKKAEERPNLYNVNHITYALHDLNGDGTEELITCGYGHLYDIVSLRNGESFHYFSAKNLPALPKIYVCEGSIVEIYDSSSGAHYYFRAEADGLSFIVGLLTLDGQWFRTYEIPTGDQTKWDMGNISETEVNQIVASYRRIQLDWKPILDYRGA